MWTNEAKLIGEVKYTNRKHNHWIQQRIGHIQLNLLWQQTQILKEHLMQYTILILKYYKYGQWFYNT